MRVNTNQLLYLAYTYPFRICRFIHDIIVGKVNLHLWVFQSTMIFHLHLPDFLRHIATIKSTGFPNGFFSLEELDSSNFKDNKAGEVKLPVIISNYNDCLMFTYFFVCYLQQRFHFSTNSFIWQTLEMDPL